ncbi:tRNA-specific adenosine deaminase TAD3-like isoform X2 [Lolium rigidum]|nr:tRNA-specific adenosine deaminase TAD3-like isoform X2 [Lolium rigidum]XP_047075300.1 tRNA-specific adenosine deaminase TAD3-like isoform X2 [Lolium rigidum]
MAWELIEVAGNLTSLQHSTVDVLAAKIEPHVANSLIRQLNQVCPLENLRHVKRVRRRIECGKPELSIILCLPFGPENCKNGFPDRVQKVVETYQLIPFIAKVASCPAMSKEDWEEQCKLWPTSYHPPHDIDGASGFKDEELPSIFDCMRTAIQLSEVGNAAIIVDPSSMQIISKAADQIHQHDASLKRNTRVRVESDGASSLSETTEDNDRKFLLSSSHVRSDLKMEVSCINLWGWTKHRSSEQKRLPSEGGFLWHPLRHAAIVAIENAAERDKMLFHTSTSSTTKLNLKGDMQACSDNPRVNWPKDKEQSAHQECWSDLCRRNMPYLCTGFDIYLVWEPCTMCAMSLVHQRFKRIFYAFPNPNAGALGSVYRLHREKSLNHHYLVFRIKMPEPYLNGRSDFSNKCCSDSASP